MSAFIVEDRTINRVVGWLNNSDQAWARRLVLGAAQISESDEQWHEKLGASMAMMNADAVNARYDESREAAYVWHWEQASDVQVLKSLQCWLYQCSEGNVPDRELYKAFEHVKSSLACEIVRRMDAYEKAEWA